MNRRPDSVVSSGSRIGCDPNVLRRRLILDIDKLVRQLYGEDAAPSGQEWHVAAVTGGKGANCVIQRRGANAGSWYDRNPHAKYNEGDVLDLIAVAKNLNADGAIRWAASWLGLTAEPPNGSAGQVCTASECVDSFKGSGLSPSGADAKAPEDDSCYLEFEGEGKSTTHEHKVAFVELTFQTAGPENLARLKSNLRRHQAALQYLFSLGLTPKTISKFHLGIREPYTRRDGRKVSDALCYPVISDMGEPLGRYCCYNIPGVTRNPADEEGWGKGRPVSYYSGSTGGKDHVLVVGGCKELWAVDQHLGGTVLGQSLAIVCPSHGKDIPDEWETPAFWSGWKVAYLGLQGSEQAAQRIARACGGEVRRVRVPGDAAGWIDFFLRGGKVEQLVGFIERAPVVSAPAHPAAGALERVGEFAADPVNINGAFANGHLYYPFTVERREVERVEKKGQEGETAGRVVTSYVTKVLRSDGAVLDIVRLAAPRGTPREKRVLALTDGTRIEREPQPNHYATWQLASLQGFIRAMQSGQSPPHRPLGELLRDVLTHLKHSVWLPYEEDYIILALYVAMSFVYQVFDAIPLVIVSGEKGTGKSELGDAVAKVAFNATIIGQGSAAGLVRLLNEARGLVVLDDLESVGRSLGDASFSDLNQMLKLSYKKQTGRKAITDKSGKTTIFDFYGPKVINNTRGVDSVLGSRMVHVRTRRMPEAVRQAARITGSDPGRLVSLRNELHVWGMANARPVHERYLSLMGRKGDRCDEISAPLRAIAEMAEDDTFSSVLELALARQPARRARVDDPVALLKQAVYNCVRQGAVRELSASQLSLELRLIADQSLPQDLAEQSQAWRQPEWIGHQLRALEIRDAGKKVSRVRLYGVITRVYELRAGYVESVVDDLIAADVPVPVSKEPLAFCEQTTCGKCPYNLICEATVRGLQSAKMLNRGKSGRKAGRLT